MNIQIASFALIPDQIYIAEKNFHSDKLYLILSDENKYNLKDEIDEISANVSASVKEVSNFYLKLNVPIEIIYMDYKNPIKMTLDFSKLLNSFLEGDTILLNLSGGRRSIPIALFYASSLINNYKKLNIKYVVIPEDKSYNPFNLLPQYIPDEIDIKLLSNLSSKKSLTQLENILGIKQPTISLRLKKLKKYGYIIIEGKNRNLTNLGQIIVKALT